MLKQLCHFLRSVHNQKGWSLMELIFVTATLGTMAYLAMPQDTALIPISLDGAAKKVVADLRYAQDMATTTGEDHGLRATGPSTYEIYDVVTGNVVLSPMTQEPMQEDLSASFGNVSFADPTYQVEFNNLGRPLTGGITLQLNYQGNNKQIEVSHTSGFIRLL